MLRKRIYVYGAVDDCLKQPYISLPSRSLSYIIYVRLKERLRIRIYVLFYGATLQSRATRELGNLSSVTRAILHRFVEGNFVFKAIAQRRKCLHSRLYVCRTASLLSTFRLLVYDMRHCRVASMQRKLKTRYNSNVDRCCRNRLVKRRRVAARILRRNYLCCTKENMRFSANFLIGIRLNLKSMCDF
jgi:hypothetical protein